jgi:hypothetical protein
MVMDKVSTSADVVGLDKHENERENCKSNPDIDFSKIEKLNYSLLPLEMQQDGLTFNERLDNNINKNYVGKFVDKNGVEKNRPIRKNATRAISLVFKASQDFIDRTTEDEQRQYFEDCYKFAGDAFGNHNIVQADVHYDEIGLPHLHMLVGCITPNGGYSAKHFLGGDGKTGRRKMQNLQDDFHKAVEHHGLERGSRVDIDAEPQARKKKSTKDFKKSMSQQAEPVAPVTVEPDAPVEIEPVASIAPIEHDAPVVAPASTQLEIDLDAMLKRGANRIDDTLANLRKNRNKPTIRITELVTEENAPDVIIPIVTVEKYNDAVDSDVNDAVDSDVDDTVNVDDDSGDADSDVLPTTNKTTLIPLSNRYRQSLMPTRKETDLVLFDKTVERMAREKIKRMYENGTMPEKSYAPDAVDNVPTVSEKDFDDIEIC